LSAKPVFQRQATLPRIRRGRAVHVFQQRLRVTPGKQYAHDLRQRGSFSNRNSFRAWDRSPTRSQRIAGFEEIVGDCSSLDMARGTPWAIWKYRSLFIAILGGIGINQDCGGAEALCR